jgi:hypothetical protein
MRKRKSLTRGERNVRWIEEYCLFPDGPNKGKRVPLSAEKRDLI